MPPITLGSASFDIVRGWFTFGHCKMNIAIMKNIPISPEVSRSLVSQIKASSQQICDFIQYTEFQPTDDEIQSLIMDNMDFDKLFLVFHLSNSYERFVRFSNALMCGGNKLKWSKGYLLGKAARENNVSALKNMLMNVRQALLMTAIKHNSKEAFDYMMTHLEKDKYAKKDFNVNNSIDEASRSSNDHYTKVLRSAFNLDK
jgi:hypothetical protein